MAESVTVIDYGINNLLSICRALEYCGASVKVAAKGSDIKDASRLVLPGVGAFPDGMKELNERGLTDAIRTFYKSGNPVMGICLGMQLLMSRGTEIKETPGIGIVEGKVIRLPESMIGNHRTKIPHVNWNMLIAPPETDWTGTILSQTSTSDYMYFVHSYFADLDVQDEILARTMFGNFAFPSALHKNNCWATQFHPEKSGERGLEILSQFLKN